MGEGKLDHSIDSGNEIVNPGQGLWKWKTVRDYAKEVGGKPWCDWIDKHMLALQRMYFVPFLEIEFTKSMCWNLTYGNTLEFSAAQIGL